MEAKTSVESLTEVFRCFICMEKPKDARICPHCSKLCCCSCIVRWLTEQRPSCPHCRASLYMRDLVNLRWAEDVSHHLDSLQSQVRQLSPDRESNCRVHPDEKQNIYCSDCDACICHKCALFTGRHVGHKFRELDDVYQEHVGIVETEIRGLRAYLTELIGTMNDVDQNLSCVREGREEAFQRMHQAWVMVCERLDTEFKERLQALKDCSNTLDKHKGTVEILLRDIECQVKSLGRTELIRKSSSLRKRIQKAREQDVSCATASRVPTEFANEIMPSFERSGIQDTFKIENFRAACLSGKPVYSDLTSLYGIQWRLKVYPNGSEMVRGQYVSVFLELVVGPTEPSKYEYKIEMMHLVSCDSAMSVGRKFVSTFEVGECWGYNRFFRLDCLETEGFLMDNAIEFQYSVRHASFYYLCRDMGWYVEQLESERTRLQQRLDQMGKDQSEAGLDLPRPVTSSPSPATSANPVLMSTGLPQPNHSEPGAVNSTLPVTYSLPEQIHRPCEQDAEQIRAPDPKLRCSNGVADSEYCVNQDHLPDDFAPDYSPSPPPLALPHRNRVVAESPDDSQEPILTATFELDEWSGSDASGSDSDSDQSDIHDQANLQVYDVSDVSDEVYVLNDELEPPADEDAPCYEAQYYTTRSEPAEATFTSSLLSPSDQSGSNDDYDGPPGLQSSIAATLARCRDNRPTTPPLEEVSVLPWGRQIRPDRQHRRLRMDLGSDVPCADGQRNLLLPCVYIPVTEHDTVESEPCTHEAEVH